MSQTNSLPSSLTSLQDVYGDQFSLAVNQAAATMDRPEYGDRLQKAMDFVLAGAVTLHDDGTATVKSGSHAYHINGECLCQDSEKRSKYCKHFLAVQLLKRTMERLHQPTNGTSQPTPQAPEAPQPPRAAAWDVQEAPASCCLKWQIGRLEILYTMRDVDDERLFARVGRVLPRIEAKLEAQRQARQEAKASQQAQASQSPKATPPATKEEDDLYCDEHDAPMRRHTKGNQSWVSHQLPDGSWCRGQ